MTVLLNEDGLVPSLEQMARAAVQPIEELGIDAVQLPHTECKVAVRRLDEKVIVVVHETVGVADPVITLVDVLEGVQEVDPVLVALEDGLSLVTPRGDMIHRASILNPQGTGHEVRVSEEKRNVKHSIPDPQRFC
jgi:hypothetical protein